MRAYIVPTNIQIEPLGDAARTTPVLNRPLVDIVADECRAAGLEPSLADGFGALPSAGPYLVLPDNVFLTQHTLRAFVRTAGSQRDNVQLGVGESRFTAESLPLQRDVETTAVGTVAAYRVAHVVGNAPADWAAVAAIPAIDVPLEVEEKKIENVPRAFAADGTIEFPWTSRPIIRLSHWVHVLRANHYALMALAAGFRERPKWKNALALAWLLIKSFPPSEARIGRALVQRGKGCKIHPSAVVEASILGNNVRIGPHSVVRACVLDDDAVVESHAHAEMSVLGKGAVMTKYTISNFNVMYPGAVLGAHGAQMSLLGRDSFVATDSRILDLSFEGDIQVTSNGRTVASGTKFLGACVGHNAKIGAGVFVQHGRAVPNNAAIVKDPGEVLRGVGNGIGRPMVVLDGTAISLRDFMRKRRGAKST